MKQVFLPGVFLFAALAGYSQHSTPGASGDEIELYRINQQFIANYLANDTVAHGRLIHPTQFLFIGTNGKFANRREYLENWAHGYDPAVIRDFRMEDPLVRVFGDMAIIIAKTTFKTLQQGQWVPGETRYSDTYIREQGEWRCVHVQLTKIAL